TRLADRGRPLGVGERDEHEQKADRAEHRRRQAERMQRDDAEREVDRGGDLAVRDGGERGRVEHALQTRELAGHAARSLAPLPAAQQVEARAAEREQKQPERVTDAAAPRARGLDEDGDPEPDRHEPEDEHGAPVEAGGHAAAASRAATITRQGACLSTKSTVSPKMGRRRAASLRRRGPPMTTISEPRRTASSTMARPALRARRMRGITRTP